MAWTYVTKADEKPQVETVERLKGRHTVTYLIIRVYCFRVSVGISVRNGVRSMMCLELALSFQLSAF